MREKTVEIRQVRWLGVLLAFALALGLALLSLPAFAERAHAAESGVFGECTWELSNDGTLTIAPVEETDGEMGEIGSPEDQPWYSCERTIERVVFEEGVVAQSLAYMFYGLGDLQSVEGLDTVDISAVSDMSYMFYGCESLESLDVSEWDVSAVEDMGYMFSYCESLVDLDVSGWNVSSVGNMYDMFRGCESLESLYVSEWDVSAVQDMGYMFAGCVSLADLDVSEWDVSAVVDMSCMFRGCAVLEDLDVSGWDVSAVEGASYMFYGCESLSSLDVSGWDVISVKNMSRMFEGCELLSSLDLSEWDVSSVSYMQYMFSGCSSLESLDLSGWDTSLVKNMQCLFEGCESLQVLSLGASSVLSLDVSLRTPVSPEIWQAIGEGDVDDPMGVAFADASALLEAHNAGEQAETYVVVERVLISKPAASEDLVYTGSKQFGVSAGEGYELSGTASATEAGEYVATATLLDGYIWSDGTSDPIEIEWSIEKAAYDMSGVSFEDVTLIYTGAPLSVLVVGEVPEGVSVSYEGNGVVDAGQHEVIASFEVDANHVPVDEMTAVLTVKPAAISDADISAISDQVWTGEAIEPELMISLNGVSLVEGEDYDVEYSDNVSLGIATITVTGMGNFQGSTVVSFEIVKVPVEIPVASESLVYTGFNQGGVPAGEGYELSGTASATEAGEYVATATLLDGYIWSDGTSDPIEVEWSIAKARISSVTFANIPKQVWTGEAIEPELSLSFNGIPLVEGEDYDVAYAKNTSPGTATITVTGAGNFRSTATVTFEIVQGPITADIPVPAEGLVYSGSEQVGVPVGEGYELSGTASATEAGEYAVTAALLDNYVWSDGTSDPIEIEWSIDRAMISSAITADVPDQIWTGEAIEPEISLSFNGTALVEGEDYDVEYVNNVSSGNASIVVAGKGNFAGEAEISFEIVRVSVDIPVAFDALVYTGSKQTGVPAGVGYELSGIASATDAGEYVATATLLDGYIWSNGTVAPVEIEWSIAKATCDMSDVSFEDAVLVYTGEPLSLLIAGEVPEGVSVSYEGNGVVDAGQYEVIASFEVDANHEPIDDMTAVLTVEPVAISGAVISVVPDQIWTGKTIEPELVISFNGIALVEGEDYGVGYANNIEIGSATVAIAGMGNFKGSAATSFKIVKVPVEAPVVSEGLIYTGSEQIGVADGKGYALSGIASATDAGTYSATATLLENHVWYDGTSDPIEIVWSIAPASIASVGGLVLDDKPVFTGSSIKPDLRLTFNGTALVEGEDYAVAYANNINPGIATVTVVGLGNFVGTTESSFEIVSKGEWKKDPSGWKYVYPDGSFVAASWQEVEGARYYFDASGYMLTGWLKDAGSWYYLKSSGKMAADEWEKVGGKWYHFGDGGVMDTGWLKDGGKWYYLKASGAMASSEWVKSSGSWYYLNGSGIMQTSKWIGDYYVLANGKMATSQWVGSYYVGANGKWIPGYGM